VKSEFIVVSGSLRDGLPIDFLSGDCNITKSNSKVIVDTSGDALKGIGNRSVSNQT
jgi:fructose-1-phosphate kinase PfkB-like protein